MGHSTLWISIRSALLLAGAFAAAVATAETRVEPRIGVGGAYVSNVELAPSDAEVNDWVAELKPGISITHDSSMFKLDLDYDLQALFYSDNSDYDDQFSTFLGSGVAELVQDRLFIDLDGRYEQRDVDPAGAATTSNLFRSGNRTDLGSWQVSPWYRQPFGDVAEGTLRYTYGQYNFKNTDADAQPIPGSDLQDSSQQRVDVGVGSPEDATGWTWRLDYLNSNVDYDRSEDYTYERAGAEVGVPVGARNHIVLAAGGESDFEDGQAEGGLNSAWWNVGWRWRPTNRQSLEARVGDRFWGNDYMFKWARKGSRGDLSLEYIERPVTFGALEFGEEGGGIFGAERIVSQAYLSKRLSGDMTWDAARSDWYVRVYWDQRDYRGDGQADDNFSKDEEYAGIAAGTRWQASARTRVDFDVDWYSRNLSQGDVDTVELSLALVRQLTPQLEARLAGGWSDQSADTGTLSEFDAATAFLGIVWRR
jgi:hypothetical protein